ncbi:high mobility group protein [Anaeramoeba flamelloides]|uniref:High mobility group protein n=1 Tax=Anaeramoeba flamelloides TaxID=1746091 RepID=A0AAV8A3L6_9EUKA|nr:high mobility group protein [Anaeramoeba flamelloides]
MLFDGITQTQKSNKKNRSNTVIRRPRSSFVYFMQTNRETVTKQNSNLNFRQISSLLGKMWRELDKSKKKKYEDLSTQDYTRWKKEVEKYEKQKKNENQTLLQNLTNKRSTRSIQKVNKIKKKYEKMAKQDRIRFEKEIKIYHKSNQLLIGSDNSSLTSSYSDSSDYEYH